VQRQKAKGHDGQYALHFSSWSGELVARGGFANWQDEVLAVALQHVLTPSSTLGKRQLSAR
jgi:hypothetical protein